MLDKAKMPPHPWYFPESDQSQTASQIADYSPMLQLSRMSFSAECSHCSDPSIDSEGIWYRQAVGDKRFFKSRDELKELEPQRRKDAQSWLLNPQIKRIAFDFTAPPIFWIPNESGEMEQYLPEGQDVGPNKCWMCDTEDIPVQAESVQLCYRQVPIPSSSTPLPSSSSKPHLSQDEGELELLRKQESLTKQFLSLKSKLCAEDPESAKRTADRLENQSIVEAMVSLTQQLRNFSTISSCGKPKWQTREEA